MTTSLEPTGAPANDAAPATTPNATAPSQPPVSSYPEPDKLGPLPGGTAPAAAAAAPVVVGDAVRARVLAEIKDAVAAARAAQLRATSDPDDAVHEARKALRRMRAVVDAVRPALSRDAHRTLRGALVDARRALGPVRDRTVAHLALTDVPPALAEHARALVAASAEAAPAPGTELELITRAASEADAEAVALAAALPDDIRPGQLARGLAATYRNARRARKRARKSEAAIHRWRRRTKELVYQLALVTGDDRAATLRQQLVDLDDSLGHVVDHLLLKDFVGTHGGAIDGSAAGALLTHVHDQVLQGRDDARDASRDLFERRPRRLRKLLRRALRAPEASASDAPAADSTP